MIIIMIIHPIVTQCIHFIDLFYFIQHHVILAVILPLFVKMGDASSSEYLVSIIVGCMFVSDKLCIIIIILLYMLIVVQWTALPIQEKYVDLTQSRTPVNVN